MAIERKYIKIPIPHYKLSAAIAIIIFFATLFTITTQAKYSEGDGYIFGDVMGYYGYLPAKFIHNDLQFNGREHQVWFYEAGDGHKRFIKYSTGLAIIFSPGFLIADVWARNSDYQRDGYSGPYQVAFICTALLFVFLALLYSIKFLRLFYNDKTTALTILIVFLGTNLFHYCTSFLTYSHLYSYTLILIFLYLSIKWLKAPSFKLSIIIGLITGLFVLVRVVDLIFVLFPLIYGIQSYTSLKERLQLFWRNWGKLTLVILFAFTVWIPQILYTYYVWGEFKLNTYTDEHFFFGNPQVLKAFFSFRNGWLVYSPLMIIPLIGLIFFTIKKKQYGYIILTVIYIYVLASWWCWWYEGFGNRAYINLYPILLVPLGYAIDWMWSKWYKSLVFVPLIFILVGYSLFQTAQFEFRTYYSGQMTYESYKESFLSLNPTAKFYNSLETKDDESQRNGVDEVIRNTYDTLKIDRSYNDEIFNTDYASGYGLGIKIPVDSANVIIVNATFSEKNEEYLYLYFEEKYFECLSQTSQSMSYQTESNGKHKVEHYFTYFGNDTCEGDSLNLLLFKATDSQPVISDLEFIYIRKTPTHFILD